MKRFMMKMCGVAVLLAVALTVAAAEASYISTVLADNPTGYWRFDETTGTTAANQISSGAAGTYTGTYTQGAAGALSASGDSNKAFTVAPNGAVAIGESAVSSIGTGDFSMEVWFNTTSTSRGDVLCYKSLSGDVDFGLIDWGGSIGLYAGGIGNSGTTAVSTNTWYDAVITRVSGTMKLYINGQLVTSYTNTTNFGSASYSLLVGSNHSSGSTSLNLGFAGSIDELSIYSTALSASQVAAHYAAAISVPEPSAAILFGSGVVAILAYTWRRRR